ncbi:FxLYD domain-containing protein [Bifidobacterium mongoliense]|uniref:DUF4190 domain-containing protein n=1 Tax=Bifidobacterium mongoliense TaxID=518643 RepID=UPI0030EE9688
MTDPTTPQQNMPQYGIPQVPMNAPYQTRHDMRHTDKPTSGMAIAALVLGIVGIALSWVPIVNNVAAVIAIIGLVLGIIAICTTGSKGRKKGRGLAIAGTVLSVLAIVITLGTQTIYGKAMDKAADDLKAPASAQTEDTPAPDDATSSAPSEVKPLASVTGSSYSGADESGYGNGVFTVHNDSDKPLKAVGLTVAELDASGKILQETYPQLDSDLQPGQSADLQYTLSPDDLGKVKSVRATKLSWMLSDDGDGAQEVQVSKDQNIK